MKKIFSLFLVVLIAISQTACGDDTNGSYNSYEENKNQDNIISVENDEATEKYHNNKYINKLIIDYNSISSKTIEKEEIELSDANKNRAYVSIDGVWVGIFATSTSVGISVEMSIEANTDEKIKAVFYDFAKALQSEIANEEIDTIWKELITGQYSGYNGLEYNDIDCTYFSSKLQGGKTRYKLTINRGNYYETSDL